MDAVKVNWRAASSNMHLQFLHWHKLSRNLNKTKHVILCTLLSCVFILSQVYTVKVIPEWFLFLNKMNSIKLLVGTVVIAKLFCLLAQLIRVDSTLSRNQSLFQVHMTYLIKLIWNFHSPPDRTHFHTLTTTLPPWDVLISGQLGDCQFLNWNCL